MIIFKSENEEKGVKITMKEYEDERGNDQTVDKNSIYYMHYYIHDVYQSFHASSKGRGSKGTSYLYNKGWRNK